MTAIIVGFALGVWLCQGLAALPHPGAPAAALVLALAVALVARRALPPRFMRYAWPLVAVLAGFGYAVWRADLRVHDQLASALEGRDVVVEGYIADLPDRGERSLRFVFLADARPADVPERLMLSWYAAGRGEPAALPAVRAGERWRLTVRLHRPHGNANPHGFDYEGWLFERGIRAVGYVRADGHDMRIASLDAGLMPRVQRLRQIVRERFERALPGAPYVGILSALAVGDQSAVTTAQWRLFSQSGTTHLASISGLHVTLFATLIGTALGWVWRRVPALCLRVPAQYASVVAGAFAAGVYVVLAGFGVPAQRTLYMLLVAAISMLSGRQGGISRALAWALLVVLLIDPWAVLSPGFWLSFGAVAALVIAASGAFAGAGKVRAWLGAQWAIIVFSLPLLLGVFQQFSLVSPLANVLAIPVISAVVTPLALLFAVLPLPSLAELAHLLLGGLMWALQWLVASPLSVWQQAAPPGWLIVAAVMLAAWALLPRGVPGRWAALAIFVPLVAWSPLRPVPGSFSLTAIDIGQGLAVHVQTAQHDLLFDTGPAFGTAGDSGERTVIPYLRAAGVPRLDALFVSHNDIDHAGGAVSILQGFPVRWLDDSLPAAHPAHALAVPRSACARGQAWSWDGVRFEVLHPTPAFAKARDNDQSCVLRVSSATGSALLTGDIERAAESDLLHALPEGLRAAVIVAPHHGSGSSSHADFIAAVAPRVAVFTNGYRNRYGHPQAAVVQRYEAAGASTYRSDREGAITITFDADGPQVDTTRRVQARYWQGV